MSAQTAEGKRERPLRVWLDGCFDMMHWGHANAIRQARATVGEPCYVIVGIHSDAEIERQKGPCIMNERERYAAARACRWVDEVVEDVPYSPTPELLVKHKVDVVIHGDDVAIDANGKGCYDDIIAAGIRFQTVRRTDGVSTTDLIARMLDPTTMDHFFGLKRAMLTTQRISQFSAMCRPPKDDDVIVYIDGGFDLFNIGHSELFRKARELGTYLVVGVHDDKVINLRRGQNHPIMNLHERVLGVLSCRYVDDVVIGAPWAVTREMIDMMHIAKVVHGVQPVPHISLPDDPAPPEDPYAEAKRAGVYVCLDSGESLTTTDIIERVKRRHALFEERNKKKVDKDGSTTGQVQH